jgi:alpha-methylacyl-CoA racemase
MQARGVYEQRDGMAQPAPAPRFSRTPGAIQDSGADGDEVIARWRAARRG